MGGGGARGGGGYDHKTEYLMMHCATPSVCFSKYGFLCSPTSVLHRFLRHEVRISEQPQLPWGNNETPLHALVGVENYLQGIFPSSVAMYLMNLWGRDQTAQSFQNTEALPHITSCTATSNAPPQFPAWRSIYYLFLQAQLKYQLLLEDSLRPESTSPLPCPKWMAQENLLPICFI